MSNKYKLLLNILILKKQYYYNLKKSLHTNIKELNKQRMLLKYLCSNILVISKVNISKELLKEKYLLPFSGHNSVNSKLSKYLQVYLNYKNNYFYWYFFNQDMLVNVFVNLIMRKGNKYVSYKHIYKSMFYIKQLTGVQPITFFKQFLLRNRLLFDIQSLVLRRKVITIPKLLSVKSQITKSLRYILNSFNLRSWKKGKTNQPLYKKISYILLNSVFNISNLRKIILSDRKLLLKNFRYLKKEEFHSKYVSNIKKTEKRRMFRIGWKSKNKKMKYIENKVRFMKGIKKLIDTNKNFILNRYNLHLQCKRKIRTKWFD